MKRGAKINQQNPEAMLESYVDKCIQSLPAAKRSAAREAFKAISDAGDDDGISKLLVTFKVTAAYALTISQSLNENGEHVIAELKEVLSKLVLVTREHESAQDERLRKLVTGMIPELSKSLPSEKLCAVVQAQTAEMGRMRRDMVRLRQVRVSGLLLVGLVGAVLGAGTTSAVGWRGYNASKEAAAFSAHLRDAGISVRVQNTGEGRMLSVGVPSLIRGNLRRDDEGHPNGVDIIFKSRDGR